MSEDDRPFALRLARYCARNPLALDRLTYEPATQQLTYRSDKTDGPTAGTQTLDPLEFLARLLTHIPDPGQVMTRYYGWYASRTRGTRARLAHLASDGRRLTADGVLVEPLAITEPVNWSLRAATAARSCSGASTRSIPSRARGVPPRCASWPSSPTRRSSPASSCTGPGAPNAPCSLLPAPYFRLRGPSVCPPLSTGRAPPASAPSRDPCRARPVASSTRRRPARMFGSVGSARREVLADVSAWNLAAEGMSTIETVEIGGEGLAGTVKGKHGVNWLLRACSCEVLHQ